MNLNGVNYSEHQISQYIYYNASIKGNYHQIQYFISTDKCICINMLHFSLQKSSLCIQMLTKKYTMKIKHNYLEK